MGWVVEQAGGKASTGTKAMLNHQVGEGLRRKSVTEMPRSMAIFAPKPR